MKYIQNIIAFLDKVPDGKSLSLRQKITLVLWGMVICLLPFLRFPYLVFEKLSLYPLLAIVILNADKWWDLCWKNKYLRYTAFAIAAFHIWQAVSLPFVMKISEISFSENICPIINNGINIGSWYVFLVTPFLIPLESIKKTFYWSFVTTFLYCGAYCVIEILHFCGVKWATDFLSRSIYYFTKGVGENYGWWPPVFWDSSRLRSVYGEPSNLAILMFFAELYFLFNAWKSKRWQSTVGNLLLMLIAAVLLCGTRSASGAMALAVSTLLFIVLFLLFFRRIDKTSRIKGAVMALLLLFFAGATIANQRGGGDDWVKIFRTVSSPKQEFSSSSATRFI